MTDLKVELLPWQQEVYNDPTRFKVIAAGRRTGKSRLAAWSLILNCLSAKKGQVFYVAPTPVSYTHLTLPTNREV